MNPNKTNWDRRWTVTLTELGTAAKAWDGGESWTDGERLGSWPKVRLRVSEIEICEWVSEIVICEWESEIVWVRVLQMRGGLQVSWNEMKKKMLGFITIFIYIGGYFSIYIYNRVGSGSGRIFIKTRTRFGFFFFKIQIWPYSLSDRVKSGPLGSGRAGYPRIG